MTVWIVLKSPYKQYLRGRNGLRLPDEETVNSPLQIFSERLGIERAEYLIGYKGNSFSITESVKEDLLSIMAVHPMREEAIKNY